MHQAIIIFTDSNSGQQLELDLVELRSIHAGDPNMILKTQIVGGFPDNIGVRVSVSDSEGETLFEDYQIIGIDCETPPPSTELTG